MEKIKAGGIIQNIKLAKICLQSVPNIPGVASAILNALGDNNINVQFIVQAIEISTRANMSICIGMDDMELALSIIEKVRKEVQIDKVTCTPNVVILSVFGPHFRDHPGIAGLVFSSLALVGINILAISTSISSISCVIDGKHLDEALDSLMEAFNIPRSAIFIASHGLSIRSKPDKGGVD